MSALDDLRPASFRGVRFLVPSGSIEEGRQAIVHNYPGSSSQYVEDNGFIPAKFKQEIIVSGPNAVGKLNALRSALNAVGPGTLIHPIDGAVFVQVDGKFTVKWADTELGVYKLDVTFATTGGAVFPGVVTGIASSVISLAGQASASVCNGLGAAWPLRQSIETARILSSELRSVLNAAARGFGMTSDLSAALRDVDFIIRDGQSVVDTLQNVFSFPFEIPSLPSIDIYRGYQGIVDVARGTEAQALSIEADTVDLLSRAHGLDVLADTVWTAGLIAMCEASVTRTYATSEEVGMTTQAITAVHDAIASQGTRSIAADVMLQVSEVYVRTMGVLQAVSIRLPEIVTLQVVDMPGSVLAYMLYDSDAEAPTLFDLNPGMPPMLFDGGVNALRN
jgi:prophage DNA circulation protein